MNMQNDFEIKNQEWQQKLSQLEQDVQYIRQNLLRPQQEQFQGTLPGAIICDQLQKEQLQQPQQAQDMPLKDQSTQTIGNIEPSHNIEIQNHTNIPFTSPPVTTTSTIDKIKKRKYRKRAIYSKEQLLQLEEKFKVKQKLIYAEVVNLSLELDITEKQVWVWFQNRRAKEKRLKNSAGTGRRILVNDKKTLCLLPNGLGPSVSAGPALQPGHYATLVGDTVDVVSQPGSSGGGPSYGNRVQPPSTAAFDQTPYANINASTSSSIISDVCALSLIESSPAHHYSWCHGIEDTVQNLTEANVCPIMLEQCHENAIDERLLQDHWQ